MKESVEIAYTFIKHYSGTILNNNFLEQHEVLSFKISYLDTRTFS
jgi:hypothetical protein